MAAAQLPLGRGHRQLPARPARPSFHLPARSLAAGLGPEATAVVREDRPRPWFRSFVSAAVLRTWLRARAAQPCRPYRQRSPHDQDRGRPFRVFSPLPAAPNPILQQTRKRGAAALCLPHLRRCRRQLRHRPHSFGALSSLRGGHTRPGNQALVSLSLGVDGERSGGSRAQAVASCRLHQRGRRRAQPLFHVAAVRLARHVGRLGRACPPQALLPIARAPGFSRYRPPGLS